MKLKTITSLYLPLLLTALCMLVPAECNAQSKKEKRALEKRAQELKENKDFYWGEGYGPTLGEAKRMALSDLQSHIFVEVNSNGNINISQDQSGDNVKSHSSSDINIETRAGGVLTNTLYITLAEQPQWRVLQYVERKEVQAVFDKRKERVNMYVGKARRGEDEGRINDALRYYYWAFCLLKTLPPTEEVNVSDQYNQMHPAITYIPDRIDDIMSNLQVKGTQTDNGEISVEATYKDRAVTSLDFFCTNGGRRSEMVQMGNGVAKMQMPDGTDTDNLQIDVEYTYEERSRRDSEDLYLTVKRLRGTNPFSSTHKTVALEKLKKEQLQDTLQVVNVRLTAGTGSMETKKKMQTELSGLLTEMSQATASGQPLSLEEVDMTDQARTALASLWENAAIQCVNTDNVQSCLSDASGYEVRGIPVMQQQDGGQKQELGELCVNFSPTGTITSVHMAMNTNTYREVVDYSRDATDLRRKTEILNFVEKFRSYYDEKDIESLRQIFSDDALIITGRVITRKTYNGDKPVMKQDVIYRRQNKTQYLNNLERTFQNNRYIHLTFDDVEIFGHKSKPNWYGVSLRQNWKSSNYEDDGYLFLLWEFPENNEGQPVIHVRTWQPEWVGKRKLTKNEIFNMDSFLIP